MIKLAYENHLWALLLLIVIAFLFASYLFYRNNVMRKIGKKSLINQLSKNVSIKRKSLKIGFVLLALAALIIAWANPLIGTKYEKVKREGIDVIFAIDVSKSMNAEDVVPSRMLKAKQVVANLIDQMSNDRIGLIVFAGNAYLQMPVTVDYSGAKMYLKNIDTDMVPKQGTAIGEAINLALNSFSDASESYKTLVIISDGEDHDGDADAAIAEAKKQGLTVITVGVGSENGATIPIDNKGNFKKDAAGNIVTSKLNEAMLANLAQQADGKYFNASSPEITAKLLNAIAEKEGRLIDEKVFTSFNNQFPLFLIIALSLLMLDLFLTERVSNLLGF